MYKLVITSKFSAAHRLVDYPGACARIHGHNWTVKVTVAAKDVDDNGMVVDLVELKRHIDACVDQFDHRVLNDVPPFDRLNPTSENIAKYLYDFISERIDIKVEEVQVAEVDDYAVIFSPPND
ncbi:6-carboxytetrahydropterin synthase QueD [candidate division KSB1 bacterium]|nr:6-carboxytetrahydropterin synthase QueD [candidate division KSB1 bacterium]RQW05590.1 MAG: 6-carboxytetrahydropterin synthase QueD [candidate division KSB1 bacterium]